MSSTPEAGAAMAVTREQIEAGVTNARGESLRCGDYVSAWGKDEHPFGTPGACPFCNEQQDYTSFWYNGPGSPPSYAFQCGSCGAQGSTSQGTTRGDHYGACIDAVVKWNLAVRLASPAPSGAGATDAL